jgi:hypothetical protein
LSGTGKGIAMSYVIKDMPPPVHPALVDKVAK